MKMIVEVNFEDMSDDCIRAIKKSIKRTDGKPKFKSIYRILENHYEYSFGSKDKILKFEL